MATYNYRHKGFIDYFIGIVQILYKKQLMQQTNEVRLQLE